MANDFLLNRVRSGGSSFGNSASSSALQGDNDNHEITVNRPRISELELDIRDVALTIVPIVLIGWTLGEIQPLSGLHPLPDGTDGNLAMQQAGLWAFEVAFNYESSVGNNIELQSEVQIREGTGTGPPTFGPWTTLMRTDTGNQIRNTTEPEDQLPGRGAFLVGRQRIVNSGLAARADDVRVGVAGVADEFRIVMGVASGNATVDLIGRWRVALTRDSFYRN